MSTATVGKSVLPTSTASAVVADSPRKVRRDLHFLRWYAHTVKHVMKRYRDAASVSDADRSPESLLASVEREVAAECHRMRSMFGAILGVILMPFLLAGFLWSGMYWLPVRILWFPFERYAYGLPLFSLYEWLAFLFLAGFVVYALVMITGGLASTRRVSTDFRRLATASPAEQTAISRVAAEGGFPRAAYLLRKALPFAAFRPLLAVALGEVGTAGIAVAPAPDGSDEVPA